MVEATTVKRKDDHLEHLRHEMRQWIEKNPLRVWRAEHGVNQRELAQMFGVSQSGLLDWEYGLSRPSASHAERVARLMGITVERLRQAWQEWIAQRPQL